ncbi:hypothetical protein, partial [Adonisia turfae]|uniref:hypothetical protein n=1 Tax=Adonisia turfae TaxID=2950184 RepID=UPI002029AA4C
MTVRTCAAEVLEESGRYSQERYTPWQFRMTASQVVGRRVCRDTFNSWRFRLGIRVAQDGCYGQEEVVYLLGWLDFRAKTGGTMQQYIDYKYGQF